MGNHLSRAGITSQSQAALKSRFCNGHKSTKPCSRRGLPSQHFSMLLVRSYRTIAPLPYVKVLGGMFLWHYPHGYPHWELPSKPDHMGARTFLKKIYFQNKINLFAIASPAFI